MEKTDRPVTLQDIARETGYSINTVSHALRYKEDIARDTAERIRQIAQEMGYTGNQIASSPRSGRTHLLAVILGGMSNPFYGIMADMIQDAAQAAGYTLIILCSRDDAAMEEELVKQAIARRVDGIILFPTNDSAANVARLKAVGKPFVLMSRYLREGDADCVVCDEEEGAYLATRHLIEGGHKKLAYISSTNVVFSSEQRIKGFLRACDALGIPESDRIIRVSNASILSHSEVQGWQMTLANELRDLKCQGFNGLFVFCDFAPASTATHARRVPSSARYRCNAAAAAESIPSPWDRPFRSTPFMNTIYELCFSGKYLWYFPVFCCIMSIILLNP